MSLTPLPTWFFSSKYRRYLFSLLSLVLLAGLTFRYGNNSEARRAPNVSITKEQTTKIQNSYGRLPISFELNQGQTDRRVSFTARGRGYGLFITPDEAVISLNQPTNKSREKASAPVVTKQHLVRMKLIGARQPSSIEGLDKLPAVSNYLIGKDPAKWRTNIPTFSKVRMGNVYQGIDLVYHGDQNQLEYDFVLAPHASPSSIALNFQGADKLRLDKNGELVLSTSAGELRQLKPVAYQEIGGRRQEVACQYRLSGNKVTFNVGHYERNLPLVIDPVILYSSFLGGSDWEQSWAVAVDAQGNAYLTGNTASIDFPLAGPFQSTGGSLEDAFVVKLNPGGTALVYSTYLGGPDNSDFGIAIAVDAQQSAYVVGYTGSNTFPVTSGVVQSTKHDSFTDAFITKLSPSGSALIYSTYLGGNYTDFGLGVGIDNAGNAVVIGSTSATQTPLAPTLNFARNGRSVLSSLDSGAQWTSSSEGLEIDITNCFAQSTTTPSVIYAGTSIGVFKSIDSGLHWQGPVSIANSTQFINVIAVDPTNANIVYAGTQSGLFKSLDAGATYTAKNSGLTGGSRIVRALAIDPVAPTTLYLGTSQGIFKSVNGGDNWSAIANGISGSAPSVNEIAIDPVDPSTLYLGLATRGLYKSTNGGSLWTPTSLSQFSGITALAIDPLTTATVYAAINSATGSTFIKSTDAGTTWIESPNGPVFATIDGPRKPVANELVVDPVTPSKLYAATNSGGLYKTNDGGLNWFQINQGNLHFSARTIALDRSNPSRLFAGFNVGHDAFVTKLNPTASSILQSTTFGGDDNDAANGVALDANGNPYIIGTTSSSNFPTANAIDTTLGGQRDAFVAKLDIPNGFTYSTFLGGSRTEDGNAIAIRNGSAYVVGGTSSGDFPLANPVKSTVNATDAFVTKLNSSGASLDFSTYLGGSDTDQAFSVAVDSTGVYVTGDTLSTDFPVVSAFQANRGGIDEDVFVAKLNPTGTAILYSSYLGGSEGDFATGIAVDPLGNAYVVGITLSSNFPTKNPFQPTLKDRDAFIAKIGLAGNASILAFSLASITAMESDTSVTVSVTRSGNTSGPASVRYATINGSASNRSDYTAAIGRLNFAAGETAKSFQVLLTDDVLVEGTESLSVILFEPVEADIGSLSTVTLNISDNDSTPNAPNPADNSEFIVRQHYHDFLNREPDPSGLQFWVDTIEVCGADVQCREQKRINMSAAFFLSIEFQNTGYLVYRMYKASYGNVTSPNVSTPVPNVRLIDFLPDTQRIGAGVVVGQGNWEQLLENNKTSFALEFVQRSRFLAAFPASMTADEFVTKLDQTAGNVLSANEKAQLITTLGSSPSDHQKRAIVLRAVAEDPDLVQLEFNRSFVLMQYFGYLRRNPDDPQDTDYSGWEFWLNKLNQFNGNFNDAEMVKAFLLSGEYRHRFAP